MVLTNKSYYDWLNNDRCSTVIRRPTLCRMWRCRVRGPCRRHSSVRHDIRQVTSSYSESWRRPLATPHMSHRTRLRTPIAGDTASDHSSDVDDAPASPWWGRTTPVPPRSLLRYVWCSAAHLFVVIATIQLDLLTHQDGWTWKLMHNQKKTQMARNR